MTSRTVRSRGGSGLDDVAWPGFVDALATVLIVAVFLLSVFMTGQALLGRALSGRDSTIARLETDADTLRALLARTEERLSERSGDLRRSRRNAAELAAERDALRRDLTETRTTLDGARNVLRALSEDAARTEARAAAAEDEVRRMDRRLEDLRRDLNAVREALGLAEARVAARDARIDDLTAELNVALAEKVKRLETYRSQFFETVGAALEGRGDVRVSGDRFVFESDIFFETASATIAEQGGDELRALADALLEIAGSIPDDVDWVLRVDGHTDARPIATDVYPSNWHLSAERAIAVVERLVALGAPSNRLAAAGFGPYRPVDPRETPDAYRRNRRIEFKLTER